MFPANRRPRRDANPTGKLQHVRRPGLDHHQKQSYQGFAYQIDRRALGMTVKRVLFSVSIMDGGIQAAYLTNLSSLAMAHSAAREWIDKEIERRGDAVSREWTRHSSGKSAS